LSILVEAVQRLLEPPEMVTDRLLLVSTLGLLVNLVGIFAFNHGHAHGHHHHHHDDDHAHDDHAHGEHKHDHAHAPGHQHNHHHHHHHNTNMRGVFLHILADTFGSVGVICSTLMIEWTGWTGWDPLASIFIAALIFASVLPLLAQSSDILLLRTPAETQRSVEAAVQDVIQFESVTAIAAVHVFPIDDAVMHASLHVTVRTGVDASTTVRRVQEAFMRWIPALQEVTVQVTVSDAIGIGYDTALATTQHTAHRHQLVNGTVGDHSHAHGARHLRERAQSSVVVDVGGVGQWS